MRGRVSDTPALSRAWPIGIFPDRSDCAVVVMANRMDTRGDGLFSDATCQFSGKGSFVPVTCELKAGGKFIITEGKSEKVRELSVLGCTIGSPKNVRKGYPYAFRLDTVDPDPSDKTAETKFVVAVENAEDKHTWLKKLGRYSGIGPDGQALPVIRFKVLQEAPYFKNWTKDNKALGLLSPGDFIEVFETKFDVDQKKNKARHAMGWTPQTAPDGSNVLEIAEEKEETPLAPMMMEATSVAPATFAEIEDFNVSMIEPALEEGQPHFDIGSKMHDQVTKIFGKGIGNVSDTLDAEDEVEGELKTKLEGAKTEYAARFANGNPPDLRELFYEVMAKMKNKKGHDANELAQQAIQAGGALWAGGNEAKEKCYDIYMKALEKVAYGSTITEPHKSALQTQVVSAKVAASDKNYHDAILALKRTCEDIIESVSVGLITDDGEVGRELDPWEM